MFPTVSLYHTDFSGFQVWSLRYSLNFCSACFPFHLFLALALPGTSLLSHPLASGVHYSAESEIRKDVKIDRYKNTQSWNNKTTRFYLVLYFLRDFCYLIALRCLQTDILCTRRFSFLQARSIVREAGINF